MGLQGGSGTITNCYYVNPQAGSPINACTVSGAKQAYTAATAPANLGEEVQAYGMVKAYQNGILYDGKVLRGSRQHQSGQRCRQQHND